jgi:hypothetical protein
MAYVKSQGTEIFYVSAPTVVTKIAQVVELPEAGGGPADEIEVTHLDSLMKEFIAGLSDNQPITFPVRFDPALHTALWTLKNSGVVVPIMIAFADGTGTPTAAAGAFSALSTRSNLRGQAFVQNFTWNNPANSVLNSTVTLRPTGLFTFTAKV